MKKSLLFALSTSILVAAGCSDDGIKETKIGNKKIDKKEESKKEDKTKEIQKKDNIKIENSINNNDINLEQNIYSTYYAKEIHKKIIIFKNELLKYIIETCMMTRVTQICSLIYKKFKFTIKKND